MERLEHLERLEHREHLKNYCFRSFLSFLPIPNTCFVQLSEVDFIYCSAAGVIRKTRFTSAFQFFMVS